MPLPAVIAHRGASREAPENTLAAFELAWTLGADGIELDVHMTADGGVVVHHDPVPPSHPDHPDLAGQPFTALTLAQVRRLRVVGGLSIPTLEEVLEAVGDRMAVYCELKGAGVVEAAASIMARHRGPGAMHSFDHRAVRRAAELAPGVPRGILLINRLVDTTGALRAAHATALWPSREFIDADLIAEVHAFGGTVVAWTVNDPDDAVALAAAGVDALCTDTVPAVRMALSLTPRVAKK